jgi:hypothetical protein
LQGLEPELTRIPRVSATKNRPPARRSATGSLAFPRALAIAIEIDNSIDIQPGAEFTWRNMFEHYAVTVADNRASLNLAMQPMSSWKGKLL